MNATAQEIRFLPVTGKPCECLKLTNEKLEASGVELETAVLVNFGTEQATRTGPFLAVRWIDKPRPGKRLPTIHCAFCPMCGKEMKD